ncbi:MAG: T9SS type A sorting domain-containing protein [Bacteroidales bacterium]
MKKLPLLLSLVILSSVLSAQYQATLRLSSTDASTLVPGDTVYVPVYCDDITPGALVFSIDAGFGFDYSVLFWTGIYSINFGEIPDWLIGTNEWSGMVVLFVDPTFVGTTVSPGTQLCEIDFVYLGGETQLSLYETSGFWPDFETTLIDGCVCNLEEYQVVFHVTCNGFELVGALVTVGNESVLTNPSGIAVFNLPNGDYNYSVTKYGYVTQEGSFTVFNEPLFIEEDLCYPINEVTIFVNCCGSPVQGATITIDGLTLITGSNGLVIFYLINGTYNLGGISFSVPETSYIDLETCGGITFLTKDGQGNPLPEVNIGIQGSMLITDDMGEADTCLQVGNYTYTASKPGFVSQTGSLNVDTIPQTVEIVMALNVYGVSIQITGFECENQFDGLLIVINGDTITPGGTTYLENGTYDISVILIGCGIQLYGTVTVPNSPVTIELILPSLPQAEFHVISNQGVPLSGASVMVDEDVLYTNVDGKASFCMTGGDHFYTVTKLGYDTITGVFNFPCHDITIDVLAVPVSDEEVHSPVFLISPNPSDGKFRIKSTSISSIPFEIHIIDLTGKIVFSRFYENEEEILIDLSNWQKGMFFIQLKSGERNWNEKLIIQ